VIIKNRTKSISYAVITSLMMLAVVLGLWSDLSNPPTWILVVALLMMPVIRQKHIKQIKWCDEYNIGIEYIDQDHKKLVHLLNQFSIAYDYAQCEDFEREALEDLVSYTKYHFKREEKLMADYNYPGLIEHQKEHQAMIDTVDDYVRIYEKQGHDSLKQVTNLLTFWLFNHIQESDKQYRDYLEQQGAAELDA